VDRGGFERSDRRLRLRGVQTCCFHQRCCACAARPTSPVSGDVMILPLLFTTGLASLAMEVVWTRQFIPFLGPVVYSFAAMLAVYLVCYGPRQPDLSCHDPAPRRRHPGLEPGGGCAGAAALLPLFAADPV